MWIFVFFFLAKLSLSFLTSSSFDGWKEKFQFLDSCQNDETRVSKMQENISSLFSSLLKTSKSFVADYEAATAKTKESYFWEQRTQHWMKMIKKWFWERRNCSKHRRLGHAKQKIFFFFINSIFDGFSQRVRSHSKNDFFFQVYKLIFFRLYFQRLSLNKFWLNNLFDKCRGVCHWKYIFFLEKNQSINSNWTTSSSSGISYYCFASHILLHKIKSVWSK